MDTSFVGLFADEDGDTMTALFREWILGLVAAAILSSLAQQFTAGGSVEKVTRFACAMMLMAALFSPVVKMDLDDVAISMASYRQTVAALTTDLEEQKSHLMRSYIEEQCAAYILDEAHDLGIDGGSVEVKAKWGEDSWIPSEATMAMTITSNQKQRLSRYITAQLGIAPERQRWNEN